MARGFIPRLAGSVSVSECQRVRMVQSGMAHQGRVLGVSKIDKYGR